MPVQVAGCGPAGRRNLREPGFVVRVFVVANPVRDDDRRAFFVCGNTHKGRLFHAHEQGRTTADQRAGDEHVYEEQDDHRGNGCQGPFDHEHDHRAKRHLNVDHMHPLRRRGGRSRKRWRGGGGGRRRWS